MATIYVNDRTSSSTSLSSGQQIDQSTTYTILIDGNYSNEITAYVYFYNGTGSFDWDSSYNGNTFTTYSYWTAKGWLGPYSYKTVSSGTAEFGDMGPDSYGTLSAVKAEFTNVPSSVSAIGVEYYDGSSWSSRYYWSCKKPITLTTPSAPTVTLSNGTFNIAWNPCTGANGSGNVSYQIVYGDSENGSTAYTSSSTTSTSMALARWVVPTWNDITYSFYVRATYSGVTRSSSTTTYTLPAPAITWSNRAVTVEQIHNQAKVTWSAATISNNYSSQQITYYLFCGSESEGAIWSGTATSVTITPPSYDTQLPFYLSASADNVSGGGWSNTTYATIYGAKIITNPGAPVVSQSGGNYVITWTPAVAAYGAATDVLTYEVLFEDIDIWSANTSTSLTHEIPSDYYGVTIGFSVRACYAGQYAWSESTQFTSEKNSHYSIRCYINNEWQDCLVFYYDGSAWIECVPYYYDGIAWQPCSF